MKEKAMKFLRAEDGLTTVEYAMAGALITAALIGAFSLLGDEVGAAITSIAELIAGVND